LPFVVCSHTLSMQFAVMTKQQNEGSRHEHQYLRPNLMVNFEAEMWMLSVITYCDSWSSDLLMTSVSERIETFIKLWTC
jgi:hypothetical protein